MTSKFRFPAANLFARKTGRVGALLTLLAAVPIAGLPTAPAQAAAFEAHHRHIEGMTENESLDLKDPASVLEYVLKMSAEEVHVGPTENYAYFKFYAQGLEWQGNMRLETDNGPSSTMHFAYFVVPAPWHTEEIGEYKEFSAEDGLQITQNSRFDYTVSFRDTTRRFLLNDITKIDLPADLRGPDELYLGQANDESGLQFYLMFDTVALDFAYILDEAEPLRERMVPLNAENPRIQVGIRTGFLFIQEDKPNRKRLIGVYEDNVLRNNYFDGPFDQLPDAYDGEITVQGAFTMIDPDFASGIDRFGNFTEQEGSRVVIAPYLSYWDPLEFEAFGTCLEMEGGSIDYRACISETLAQ